MAKKGWLNLLGVMDCVLFIYLLCSRTDQNKSKKHKKVTMNILCMLRLKMVSYVHDNKRLTQKARGYQIASPVGQKHKVLTVLTPNLQKEE